MDKYSKGKIYLIRNKNDNNLIYVGSTIEEYLSKRFCKHKTQKNCSLYCFINNPENNSSWNDWYIELYEEFPCENKLQLVRRENEIIREKATINKIGFRTEEMKKQKQKEYRETHKEEIKQRDKRYIENNREKILKKKAEYNEKNKEYKRNYMKERYEQNKEEFLEKQRQYNIKNKEEINKKKREYGKQKFTCECGSCIRIDNKNDHFKTKKHQNYLSLNNTPSY